MPSPSRWIAALPVVFALSVAHAELKDGSPAEVKADFEIICHASERAGAAKVKDPSKRAEKIANYLLGHLVTKQAMRVMSSMGGMPPEEKPAALLKAARDAGYAGPCPFVTEK